MITTEEHSDKFYLHICLINLLCGTPTSKPAYLATYTPHLGIKLIHKFEALLL